MDGIAADVVIHAPEGFVVPQLRTPALVKIATSSTSFAREIEAGELTQLEWLDVCANELESDAVVFDAAQFPRTDPEYLAQLKKTAVDLGLTVAGVAVDRLFESDGQRWFAVASELGAPLAIATAPPTGDDPDAWGIFADAVKLRSRDAKRANVTLALTNAPKTLCASASDLRRIAKDVDSAWLRFALDPLAADVGDDAPTLLAKCVIVRTTLHDVRRFAQPGDRMANALIRDLARFRGCVLFESGATGGSVGEATPRDALHHALYRFAALRATALTTTPA